MIYIVVNIPKISWELFWNFAYYYYYVHEGKSTFSHTDPSTANDTRGGLIKINENRYILFS